MKSKGRSKQKLTVSIVEDRLREHPTAPEILNVLVSLGCERSTLLFLLAGQTPTVGDWKHFQVIVMAHPRRLKALAHQAGELADAIDAAVVNTLIPNLFDPLESFKKTIQEVRELSGSLRELSANPGYRAVHKAFSYRQMGTLMATALVCHYVKSKTGKPRYKETSELLSAASGKTVSEDVLKHRANRAYAKLNFEGKLLNPLNQILVSLTHHYHSSGREQVLDSAVHVIAPVHLRR